MKPNLSVFERVVRPLIGIGLILLALSLGGWGLLEWGLLIAGVFLILNGLLARCYLWRWLGLNTAQNEIQVCQRRQDS